MLDVMQNELTQDDTIEGGGQLPGTDVSRLAALKSVGDLGNANDPDFDRLTWLAGSLLEAPIALVSIVDTERQWFKSRRGVDLSETPIDLSFCAHAVAAGDEVMVVPDATVDHRFLANTLVTGPPHIRFYAGAPITVHGTRVGTLCVIDTQTRQGLQDDAADRLKSLAALASSLFTLKDTERRGKATESALVRSEKRHKLALEAANIASWVWDLQTGAIECDLLLPQLFGMPPAPKMRARRLFVSVDPRDIAGTEAQLKLALEGNDDYAAEYRIRDSSPERWVATRGRVIERDADGKAKLAIGVSYDISDRKSNEGSQRRLLRELNHRVKNTLATVQALASQTIRHAEDPRGFLDAFSSRLQALGRAHGLLSDLEWRGIDLRTLLFQQTQPKEGTMRRINVSGPTVWLSPDQALAMTPLLNELTSNALKYGALSTREGSVDIDWSMSGTHGSQRLRIVWRERGGPKVSAPSRTGFGSILITRSLDKILSSKVHQDFRPDGLVTEISLPVEDQTL
jgi:two-component sensor histidine kinase